MVLMSQAKLNSLLFSIYRSIFSSVGVVWKRAQKYGIQSVIKASWGVTLDNSLEVITAQKNMILFIELLPVHFNALGGHFSNYLNLSAIITRRYTV